MSNHICPHCSTKFERSIVIGKIILGLLGLYLGKSLPARAIGLGAAGTTIGHMLDTYIETQIAPQCPACGFVLLLVVREAESSLSSTL
jgi:uncharacterized protein (UPF0212 family)